MDLTRRVIVALDFDTAEDAEAVVDRLGAAVQSYKIGLQLLTAAGPALVTTLAAAVRAAGRRGATMGLLGPDMLIVTPGVTLLGGPAAADHVRSAHPADAFRAGASHIVIGRALTTAPDPAAALRAIS